MTELHLQKMLIKITFCSVSALSCLHFFLLFDKFQGSCFDKTVLTNKECTRVIQNLGMHTTNTTCCIPQRVYCCHPFPEIDIQVSEE